MKNNTRLVRIGAEWLAAGAMAGILVAGCGGGGGGSSAGASVTPSASGTAVASFVADRQNNGFTGYWSTGGASASATASTRVLGATGSPTLYSITYVPKALANGAWSNTALGSGVNYELSPTGWAYASMVGQTLADSGDGSHFTVTLTSGTTTGYRVARTSLAGTAVSCLTASGSCTPASAVYPAGAASYTLTSTTDTYTLFNLQNGLQVTDQNGAALTSLPTLSSAFCDPLITYFYQPQAPAYYTSNWYSVYIVTGCNAAAISSALLSPPAANVMISIQPTGNAVVPNVLLLTNWTPGFGLTNPWLYGVRGGYVWEGLMEAAGGAWSEKNKLAVNAEVQGSGYAPIP